MSEVSSAGGAEPDPKRRRLLDAGGPVEDDETARQKMRDARVGEDDEITGFDPDNVTGIKYMVGRSNNSVFKIRPMGYFARKGDLKMMRWLYVNGADTRDEDVGFYFPMVRAVSLEACKWLFDHGAPKDVARRTIATAPGNKGSNDLSPLYFATLRRSTDLIRWLILKGALCKGDGSGILDIEVMNKDLSSEALISRKSLELLLEWANELHQARNSFLTFMSGTHRPKIHAYNTRRPSCPLKGLGGKSGILEHIYEYVGCVGGREARIVRQLTEMLPQMI